MNKKQTILVVIVAISAVLLAVPPVHADPTSDRVTCNDGERVTANITDAKPNDVLDDADFQAACRRHGHGGYNDQNGGNNSGQGQNSGGSQDGGGYTEGGEKSCAGAVTSLIKCANNGGSLGVGNLILVVVNFMAIGVGIVVVGAIIVGGIIYSSANGEPAKAQKGITTIVNAVIGLILYIFSYALVNFLVPGGVFK